MPKGCRICRFWEKYSYRVSERELFEKKVRESTSLRKLELLLESYGLKAKKDLINRHIHDCMGIEAKEQREQEKEIKTEGIRNRVKEFFIRPQELPQTEKCEHLRTESFWDISSERVHCRCLDCGEILGFGVDAQDNTRRMEKDSRNLIIYGALKK